MSNPKIYVACLASYNAGILHGTWIELDGKDVDDVHVEIQAMLSSSTQGGAEEWAIHDHDDFHGLRVAEHEDLENLIDIAAHLTSSRWESEVVAAAIAMFPTEWKLALEEYCGRYESEGDYAHEVAHDCHTESELGPFANYIDWAAVERDWELNQQITVVEGPGGRHIFRAF